MEQNTKAGQPGLPSFVKYIINIINKYQPTSDNSMISNKAAIRYEQQAKPTHAKQWLSKQRYIAIQGLLGWWGSWLVRLNERHNIFGGRIKQSF